MNEEGKVMLITIGAGLVLLTVFLVTMLVTDWMTDVSGINTTPNEPKEPSMSRLDADRLSTLEMEIFNESESSIQRIAKELLDEVYALRHELADPRYMYASGRINRQSLLHREAQIEKMTHRLNALDSRHACIYCGRIYVKEQGKFVRKGTYQDNCTKCEPGPNQEKNLIRVTDYILNNGEI